MKSKLFGLFFVLALLASLLGASSASAQAPLPPAQLPGAGVSAASIPLGAPGLSFRYVKTFGTAGAAYLADTSHLNYPWGLGTIGSNVWIGELWGNRALKYSSAGSFVRGIGTAGDPDVLDTVLMGIADVAADAAGNVWLADASASHVAKFNSSGQLAQELGVVWGWGTDNAHFAEPVGVALDSGGNVYVSDGSSLWDAAGNNGNQRVQVFNAAGEYVTTIGISGESGTDNDHFRGPKHLAVYGTRLYVADSGNQRVQIFDITAPAAPAYVATMGETGVGGNDSSHFNHPSGVAVDTDYIYVADTDNNRVQVFYRSNRTYVKTIGGTWGGANNQFKSPTDVAVDANHRLYVADFNNTRVQQFTHTGATFTYARTYGVRNVPYLTDGSHLNKPSGVAVAGDGSIYLTEDMGSRLIKLNASGIPQWQVGLPGVEDSSGANNRFNNPQGVAIDSSNRVFVADQWFGRVMVYSAATGAYLSKIEGLGCPGAVHTSGGGDLYVADSCDATVKIYDSSLALQHTIGEPGVAGSDQNHFNWPMGVAVDSEGNIYVSDSGNHRVQVYDSNRAYLRTIGITGECSSDFEHICNPDDLFIDGTDRLYVADSADRIEVFDSSSAYLTTIGGMWSRENNGLRVPRGVAVDSAGNVYVADTNNHRIQKFALGVPGWTQSNINGFGQRELEATRRLAVFGGELYVGGGRWPAQLWKTASGTSWTPVTMDGFGEPTNSGIADFVEFNGKFYASTWSWEYTVPHSNNGQIWRSADGAAWEKVVTNGFGGSPDNTVGIGALVVFANQIYAATAPLEGTTQIYRSATGDSGDWAAVVTDGFGSGITWGDPIMDVYDGYLYVGTGRDGTGELWRTSDGAHWSPVFTDGLAADNRYVSSMAEFNGVFYIGLQNDATGGEIWKSTDGVAFARAARGGLGHANNYRPSGLYVANNTLFAVFDNAASGAEVWRSPDGVNWTQIGFAGWGDGNNSESDAGDNGAVAFQGRLYLGTQNLANGGEIWSMALPQTDAFTSTGAQDGWILESGENTGVGGTMKASGTTFNLGDDATKKQYRALLSFDTSGLPEGAVIQSAVLRIKQSGAPVGINPFNVLGKLLVDIRKPYFGTTSNLQLADFNAASSAAKVGSFGKAPATGWYSVTLNATGLKKINTSGLTQLRLYFSLDDNNNLLANYMKFFSGEAASGNQPILYITYLAP